MGCDIHMYIEYKRKNREDFISFGQRINPGRNYSIFGLLSKGVMSSNPDGIEPKGNPKNLGWISQDDAYLYIDDKLSENDNNYCSLESALRWATYGCEIIYRDEKAFKVEHPDWHSHSWLTTKEFEEQMIKYNRDPNSFPAPEYMAVLAAMKELEKYENECRIVFWFKN